MYYNLIETLSWPTFVLCPLEVFSSLVIRFTTLYQKILISIVQQWLHGTNNMQKLTINFHFHLSLLSHKKVLHAHVWFKRIQNCRITYAPKSVWSHCKNSLYWNGRFFVCDIWLFPVLHSSESSPSIGQLRRCCLHCSPTATEPKEKRKRAGLIAHRRILYTDSTYSTYLTWNTEETNVIWIFSFLLGTIFLILKLNSLFNREIWPYFHPNSVNTKEESPQDFLISRIFPTSKKFLKTLLLQSKGWISLDRPTTALQLIGREISRQRSLGRFSFSWSQWRMETRKIYARRVHI